MRELVQKQKQKQRKNVSYATRVSDECAERLGGLEKELNASSRADLMRMILEHAVGIKTLDGVSNAVESIRQAREEGYLNTPATSSAVTDAFIGLLNEINIELKSNRAELKKVGDFYHQRFDTIDEKIKQSTASIEDRLKAQTQTLNTTNRYLHQIGKAVVAINKKVEELTKYFNTVFLHAVTKASFGVIENFTNRFFSQQGNGDSVHETRK